MSLTNHWVERWLHLKYLSQDGKCTRGNSSTYMCTVRARLRFMSLKTLFSSWAKPLSSLQEMCFAAQRMLSPSCPSLYLLSPASQDQRSKAWLLHPEQFNIIVTTISHKNAHTHIQRDQRRTFHNSKEPGGMNILRKQHSLPVKLSQANGCSGW